MSCVYYTKDHEFIRVEDGIGVVGVTDYAIGQLGDIVYLELPQADQSFRQGEASAVIESVKAASEVYAPVSGTVLETNQALADNPALLNDGDASQRWFFRMSLADNGELGTLMDEASYQNYLNTLS